MNEKLIANSASCARNTIRQYYVVGILGNPDERDRQIPKFQKLNLKGTSINSE